MGKGMNGFFMNKLMVGIFIFIFVIAIGFLYGLIIHRGGADLSVKIKIDGNIFNVEVAKSVEELAKGLSDRENLEQGSGMLFVFNWKASRGFWMKDMKIPLDIVWISGTKIVGCEKNVLPPVAGESLKAYYPPQAVDKVLEINAGLCDELGIVTGQSVEIDGNIY